MLVPSGPSNASQTAAAAPSSAAGAATPAGKVLHSCIEAAADALIANAARLDELDSAVGDGDCGSTLATAAKAIKQVGQATLASCSVTTSPAKALTLPAPGARSFPHRSARAITQAGSVAAKTLSRKDAVQSIFGLGRDP